MAKHLLNVAAIPAAMLAAACVIVATWGALAEDPFEQGIAFGNKELVSFRQGYDFRVGFLTPAPTFGLRMRPLTQRETELEDATWGRPDNWLRLPSSDFSLWWPFSACVVVLCLWVVMRRLRSTRGFPVMEAI